MRESGQTGNQIMKQISNDVPSNSYYARAMTNQADNIREDRRNRGVRSEMARSALEYTERQSYDRLSARIAAGVER